MTLNVKVWLSSQYDKQFLMSSLFGHLNHQDIHLILTLRDGKHTFCNTDRAKMSRKSFL